MLFFRGITRRSSSKSKGAGDDPQSLGGKDATSVVTHHQDGVNSKSSPPNEEEILMQVSHLQSEMSRLNLQLASIQARSRTDQGKEEHSSTQRSNRTFSTKGTTQPHNTTPGSIPRAAARPPGSSPRRMQQGTSHVPHGGSSTDRPPPVSQIFIPTPASTTNRSAERSRQRVGTSKQGPKSPKVSRQQQQDRGPASMDRLVHQRGHTQIAWREEMRSDEKRGYPAGNKSIPPEVLVVQERPKTRSSWRSFQSWTASSAGHSKATSRSNVSHGSKSSSRRVRYRTVKRISSGGTPSAPIKKAIEKSSSPPRPSMWGKVVLQPPCLLTPSSTENGHTTGSHTDTPTPVTKPSKSGKIRVVWPPPPKSKGVKKPAANPFSSTRGSDHEKEKGYQLPQRPKTHITNNDSSAIVVPSPSKAKALSSVKQDKTSLLSQIRKSDLKLKPAIERRPSDHLEERNAQKENDKSGWGGLFAAIQGGVALKRIDTQPNASTRRQKLLSSSSPSPSPLLLQLQQRKKEWMRKQQSNQ